MRISEEKIEEIRQAADIVDTISGYVQLKKRGKNYIGLCPFHNEKTPSFTVSGEKQIFHCFGCHAGGNVFKFIMDYKSISFVEAVQEVAEQNGIKIEFESRYNPEEQSEQEILYDINKQAGLYFSNNLLKSDEGAVARNYFKNRNVKLQTQRIFGLGYAFNEWEHFLQFARDNKIDLQKAKQLGLIDTRDNGTYYDKYRGRIIFPIFSTNGRVIAFGGRIITGQENTAKYINSPESIVYSKRRSLYGLYHSKEEIRKLDKAILVEGYMDLISLYQAGIKHVVASSGTSLTEDQVKLLSRFTKNISILFDADPAGQKAAMRSIEILLKEDFDVKVVALPDNEDPDSFVNKYGKDKFNEEINKAKNFLEHQLHQFEKDGMLEDPVKQAEAVRQLISSASLITDELKRNLLLKSISRKFNLREKLIETELEKFLKKNKREENTGAQRRRVFNNAQETNAAKTDKSENMSFELELIKLLFENDEEIIGYIFDNILPEEFENTVTRSIAEIVYNCFTNNIVSPAGIIEKIEDEELKQFVFKLTIEKTSISKKWEEIAHEEPTGIKLKHYTYDLIKKHKLKIIDKQLRSNNSRLKEDLNENELMEILQHNKELQKEKKELIENKEFTSLS
ncbi:MAG: DNA primase [Ignavibacteria bacterium]|jgi:DNA primase